MGGRAAGRSARLCCASEAARAGGGRLSSRRGDGPGLSVRRGAVLLFPGLPREPRRVPVIPRISSAFPYVFEQKQKTARI